MSPAGPTDGWEHEGTSEKTYHSQDVEPTENRTVTLYSKAHGGYHNKLNNNNKMFEILESLPWSQCLDDYLGG